MHAPDVAHDPKFSKRLDSTPGLRYPPESIMLVIANFSEEELTLLTLPKGTILRVAQEISEGGLSDEEYVDRGT
jgi:hypothetical protein